MNHQSRTEGDVGDEPGENNVLKLRDYTCISEVTNTAERPSSDIFRSVLLTIRRFSGYCK